jgi:hypothetical protein
MLKELSGVVEEGRGRVLEDRADEFKVFSGAGTRGERREGIRREVSLLTRAGIELRDAFLGGIVGGYLKSRTLIRVSVDLCMTNNGKATKVKGQ